VVAVALYPAAATIVPVGGTSVIAMYGPLEYGGLIVNPYQASDQGLVVAENLYVSLVGPAGLLADGVTVAIPPGGIFNVPSGTLTDVWVNSPSNHHRFSAYTTHPFTPYTPPSGTFPPELPTTLTKIIPSYLYVEYNDDEDLQAFVRSFNANAQAYCDWFVNIYLPVYTGLSGDMLSWIGAGLYGFPRPVLPSGTNQNIGPLNTYKYNQHVPFNKIYLIGNQNYYITTDDVYQRILTWHLFKGDGKYFTIRWLKRRVMRFLVGTNGTSPNIDNTYPVSVTFGVGHSVNINIPRGRRSISGGILFNRSMFNQYRYNQLITVFVPLPSPALAPIFKAAVDAGVLELPFQFTFTVNID